MARSVRLREDKQAKVIHRLLGEFFSQKNFAEQVEMAESTVSNFIHCKPVDRLKFIEICDKLGLDWRDYATSIQPKPQEPTPPNPENPQPHIVLEYPAGQMELNSPFYIERPPIEQRCYEEVSKPGSLIRIKAPRQMGKSSLLTRILDRAEQQGDETVYLSLQVATIRSFSDLDTFLKWFCASVTRALNLPLKLDEYWDLAETIGGNLCCQDYFERYLLPEINKPITLGLDEADRLFEYPKIYEDFFGLLRALHEEGKHRSIWKRLRLVIVHSTEVYLPINLNKSPFNVGLPIELPELTPLQVQKLARLHQLNWSDKEVMQIMEMVGGHPFLVRLALYHVALQDITLTQLLQTAPTTTGIYKSYLGRIESILSDYPELEAGMKEVITTAPHPQLDQKTRSKLTALGLLKIEGEEVSPSCNLFQQYFSK